MNPLQSLREYEKYIYTLGQRHPSIRRSTLTFVRRGSAAGRLTGELEIGDCRLVVREKLSFEGEVGPLLDYGYELWRGGDKQYWYDSQAHPNDPLLAAPIPTINMYTPTSSTIGFQRLVYHLLRPTCPS